MIKISEIYNVSEFDFDQVYRIDDPFNLRSGYFEIHEVNFHLPDTPYPTNTELNDHGVDHELKRYFARRYFLFRKFDYGIRLDNESWYSAIGEPIANYICERLKHFGVKSLFEPFCGAGGFAISAALKFSKFIANDIDGKKISLLKNNLLVYGADLSRIQIYNKDALEIVPFEVDAVFLSPPWGGVEKADSYSYEDLDDLIIPKLSEILNHYKKFTSNIILQLPKTTNILSLFKVLNHCLLNPIIQIERIKVAGKPSQLLVYIGKTKFTDLSPNIFDMILTDTKKNIADKQKARSFIQLQLDEGRYDMFEYIFKINNPGTVPQLKR